VPAAEIEGAAAVVNLAGASVNGGRWNAARKQALRDSRLRATGSLAAAIAAAQSPPPVFVSGSGVGYYGDRGSSALSEYAGAGDDFMAHLCVDAWAQRAARSGVRVVVLRTGLVLKVSGVLEMAAVRFFVERPIDQRHHVLDHHDWIEDGTLDRRRLRSWASQRDGAAR
jgi:NAD dependent epimerase/dehydratase family enzyme